MKLPTSDEIFNEAMRVALGDILMITMNSGERAGVYRIIHAAGISQVSDLPLKKKIDIYNLCVRTIENRK